MTAERDAQAAAAHRFLDALERMDLDEWTALWHVDGEQHMPFAPDGFPGQVNGRDALRRHYAPLTSNFTSMRFVDRTAHRTDDPDTVILEYRGLIELAAGGRYDNSYIGVFMYRDGLLWLFREYFNPIVLQRSFQGASGAAGAFGTPPNPMAAP